MPAEITKDELRSALDVLEMVLKAQPNLLSSLRHGASGGAQLAEFVKQFVGDYSDFASQINENSEP